MSPNAEAMPFAFRVGLAFGKTLIEWRVRYFSAVAFSVLGPRPTVKGIMDRQKYWEMRIPYTKEELWKARTFPEYRKAASNPETLEELVAWPIVHDMNITMLAQFTEEVKMLHDEEWDECPEAILDPFVPAEKVLQHFMECPHQAEMKFERTQEKVKNIFSGVAYQISKRKFTKLFPDNTLPVSDTLSLAEKHAMRRIAEECKMNVSIVYKHPINETIDQLLKLKYPNSRKHMEESTSTSNDNKDGKKDTSTDGEMPYGLPTSPGKRFLFYFFVVFAAMNFVELVKDVRRILNKMREQKEQQKAVDELKKLENKDKDLMRIDVGGGGGDNNKFEENPRDHVEGVRFIDGKPSDREDFSGASRPPPHDLARRRY